MTTKIFKKTGIAFLLLLVFWILIFDFQRLLFSIHNLDKIDSFGEWILVFFHSIRLDIAMGSYLSFIPIVFLLCYIVFQKRTFFLLFKIVLLIELVLVCMIHSGEINAYGEWNHKLTSRVFMHLANPDEVVRTADYSMTFWFVFYLILEIVFGFKIFNWLFKKERFLVDFAPIWSKIVVFFPVLPLLWGFFFLFARGGWQQIPINIDAAYYSKNYVLNDISVNSPYFFGKSFLLYKRSNIGQFLSKYDDEKLDVLLEDFYNYEKTHDNLLLKTETPNLVFIILESWTAKVSNALTGEEGFTEEFDKLAQEGVLFTNIYSASTTSEIGNASIFSGFPALPEISISMQPFKHRKLTTINESLKPKGYTAGYLFSGDLKYGNIGSFFTDHGFERVEDEDDFPPGLEHGKLNYYDEALYDLFLEKIGKQKAPFIECAFTGSTHSPYDYPGNDKLKWRGKEENFVNSVIYADSCLGDFIAKAKQEEWYKNTLFVIVADHGHASPTVANPSDPEFYHIPLLFFGDVIKEEAKGKRIEKVGSQSDIPQTLLYQLGVNTTENYPWSKDLLNPHSPEFALLATMRGFGWVTPKGKFSYHLDFQKYLSNTFEDEKELKKEREKCNAFMQRLYTFYEKL